jgi:hypothetical protein
MGEFEIIRKKTKETYKTLFDPENVFYKNGNFIRHHFLKITSVKCCPFRCTHSEDAAQCVLRNVGDVFFNLSLV